MSRTYRRKAQYENFAWHSCYTKQKFHSDNYPTNWGWKSNKRKKLAKRITKTILRRMRRDEMNRILGGDYEGAIIHSRDHMAIAASIRWDYLD